MGPPTSATKHRGTLRQQVIGIPLLCIGTEAMPSPTTIRLRLLHSQIRYITLWAATLATTLLLLGHSPVRVWTGILGRLLRLLGIPHPIVRHTIPRQVVITTHSAMTTTGRDRPCHLWLGALPGRAFPCLRRVLQMSNLGIVIGLWALPSRKRHTLSRDHHQRSSSR